METYTYAHACTRIYVTYERDTSRNLWLQEDGRKTGGNGKCLGRPIGNPFRRTFNVSVGNSHHVSAALSRLYCAARERPTSKKLPRALVISRERGKKKYGWVHTGQRVIRDNRDENYSHLQLCTIGSKSNGLVTSPNKFPTNFSLKQYPPYISF